ncbi:hypothetical protein L4X63_17755 [Geomonas sp. Red32]|uniref:hypothetical protein n=1 Tax=Geomonas sp. Red32 TaxID=2912856 RepID=UPI00202CAF49|nr:hypothetical protein [Geomonas sp. Red32]MCM0083433.1 hypothetical protein [Geomonas sp. Red32]
MRMHGPEPSDATVVTGLSLLLSVLIWTCVMVERPAETTLKVPLRAEHIPAGLKVTTPLPENVEVTVAGPGILLWPLRFVDPGSVELDLSTAAAGAASFAADRRSLRFADSDLKVVRMYPANVRVTLVTISGQAK